MLTHSIRRKLIFGLCLVSMILTALVAGGGYVLMSYERVVEDFDRVVNDAPRRDEMLDAIVDLRGHMRESLGSAENWTPGMFLRRGPAIEASLTKLREATVDFRRRLQAIEGNAVDSHARIVGSLLYSIEAKMYVIGMSIRDAGFAKTLERETLVELNSKVDDLFDSVWQLDEPTGDMAISLSKAHKVYEAGYDALLASFVVSCILLVWLMRCGYRWLFKPIRELYEGASRVAQGDFDYRIQLNQKDEMGELADAFNKMTVRFQEIKFDLDRQVRDRVKQLIRSERLASIGLLASGISHEINTPLTGISIAAQSILSRKDELFKDLPPEEQQDLEEYLDILRTEPQQCRSITQRLLAFSRGEGDERMEFDLTEAIKEVLNMLGHLGKFRSYQLVFEHDNACLIEANRSEIKQVILNLSANGLEAMEEGGKLTVELFEATDQVEIRITDEGQGMTPEVIERVFEPFFTENKDGFGTGLGLAITHRIISDHGGTIEPESQGPGKGTVFHVHLPRKAANRKAA